MRCFLLVFTAFFALSCGGSAGNAPEMNAGDGGFSGEAADECEERPVSYQKPSTPGKTVFSEIKKYSRNSDCVPLPEAENGELALGEGCFSGCLKVGKKLKISGKGAENTMIVCNDTESAAVVEVLPDAGLVIEDISLSGSVRCIYAEKGSRTEVRKSVLSHCAKGGINVCPDESGCRADLVVSDSFIGDIDEAPSGISYGISFGNGRLDISGSEISGLNSFGIAVWGESGEKNSVNIEDSRISGVYGGLRSYEGHGFYAENSASVTIKNSSVSDTAASFILVSSESGEMDLKLVDFTAENILETGEEQGGIVLDGNVSACLERVLVENSRGNALFSRGARLYAEDLSVKSVFSDGLCANGFALQLVDGSESFIKRLSVVSAEKAGILLDGICSADIEDFEIISTRSDSCTYEFGVGAAVQDGASVIMRNGLFSDNRESGILAIDAAVLLENVEIRDTRPRSCTETGNCLFAPDAAFGHGISLYSSSKLQFGSVTLFNNNNGLNIAASEVAGFGSKSIFFGKNSSAVNAWDIDDLGMLDENLSNSSFCGNGSVFTSDSQPVREGL